jgi:hypothetical protein
MFSRSPPPHSSPAAHWPEQSHILLDDKEKGRTTVGLHQSGFIPAPLGWALPPGKVVIKKEEGEEFLPGK